MNLFGYLAVSVEGGVFADRFDNVGGEECRWQNPARAGGLDTIINTGAWTNMSVEHTARTAADKAVSSCCRRDCCSTMNADWHNAAINYALQNVSVVTKAERGDRGAGVRGANRPD